VPITPVGQRFGALFLGKCHQRRFPPCPAQFLRPQPGAKNLSGLITTLPTITLSSVTSTIPGPPWCPTPCGQWAGELQQHQYQFRWPGTSFVARLNSSFSPTLLNEFVASYTTDISSSRALGPWSDCHLLYHGLIFSNASAQASSHHSQLHAAYGGGQWGNDSGYPFREQRQSNLHLSRQFTKTNGQTHFQFGAISLSLRRTR